MMRPGIVAYVGLLDGSVRARDLLSHLLDLICILQEELRCDDVLSPKGFGEEGGFLGLRTHRAQVLLDGLQPSDEARLADINTELRLHRNKHIAHGGTCLCPLGIVASKDLKGSCRLFDRYPCGIGCRTRHFKGLR